MAEPVGIGSYREGDVRFLLTDLSKLREEQSPGTATSETPAGHFPFAIEYQPSNSYLTFVRGLLISSASKVALLCAVLAEQILTRRGPNLVLVSIARAGTPAGVIIKRWLEHHYALSVPHYSVAITGNRGLDRNAIHWLCRRYDPASLQFVDAWTSKGTVQTALESANSCLSIPGLDTSLAVLADTGWCTSVFATRDDFLFPHACLGATMSGLLSHTAFDPRLLAEDDFHGVISYAERSRDDLSRWYIEATSARFHLIRDLVQPAVWKADSAPPPDQRGAREASILAERYGASKLDLVNVGTSETTRAFFRRRPELLLVHPSADEQVGHLLQLADDRNVPVRQESSMPFHAALI